MPAPMIRRCSRSKSGWNNGDFDVALQLFQCGMVWDGNLASKSSRDHLVMHGYAVRHGGMQALTGRGVLALLHPRWWPNLLRRWWRYGRSPLVADKDRCRRAMT